MASCNICLKCGHIYAGTGFHICDCKIHVGKEISEEFSSDITQCINDVCSDIQNVYNKYKIEIDLLIEKAVNKIYPGIGMCNDAMLLREELKKLAKTV